MSGGWQRRWNTTWRFSEPWGRHSCLPYIFWQAGMPAPLGGGRRGAELDVVAVGVDDIELERAVGAGPPRGEVHLVIRQVLFPGVEIIDQQGKVIAAVVRDDLARPPADE